MRVRVAVLATCMLLTGEASRPAACLAALRGKVPQQDKQSPLSDVTRPADSPHT